MQALRKRLSDIRAWVATIWDQDLGSLSGLRRLVVRTLRIGHLVIRGFREDQCPLHASSLTFTTLMSVVPILALSLALMRGLGDAEMAKDRMRSAVHEWTERFDDRPLIAPFGSTNGATTEVAVTNISIGVAAATNAVGTTAAATPPGEKSELAGHINNLLEKGFEKVENISFGALGGIGLVMLLLMVVSVLGRVESSFNRVWGIREGRPFWRRCTDYLSIVVILPFLVTAASSLPLVELATHHLGESSGRMMASLLASGLLKDLAVLCMTALTFTFVIMFMPNTRVRPLAGFVGGLVAAVLFVAWLGICARLQVGVARYGRIYGSFAVLPIVLAWVHVSWDIVLLGAEVAFAVQNHATFHMEQRGRSPNVYAQLALALGIVGELSTRVEQGHGRLDTVAYAGGHGLPVRFVNAVVDVLAENGILGPIADETGGHALLGPARQITVGDITTLFLSAGTEGGALGVARLPECYRASAQRALSGEPGEVWQEPVAALASC